ncbi:MAG: competence/damage-inducible protein A, partial [Firmicutes bacterium]|nr:competence/damage-inducible protein A [Bacillota bacterium]
MLAAGLRQAMGRSDRVITTGGLGPTTDDLTKETVADILGLPMYRDEAVLAGMKEFFARRGLSMPEIIEKQACFPAGASILPNSRGTAPGALLEKNGKLIALLPGPPNELIPMFEECLLPVLAKKAGEGLFTRYKVFKLTGISETAVFDRLKDLGGQGNPGIAYVVKPGEVQVRITAQSPDSEQAEKMVAQLSEKVRRRLVGYIFGYDEEVLEEVVGKLLLETGLTIAVAESCTGGMIAARLTDVPGSSGYMKGGVVAYSNDMKKDILGVPAQTLDLYGAISKQTAVAMAEGVRGLAGSNLGLAVTGIAGPGGGTPAKPMGLVYISLVADDSNCCREYRFPGERFAVRQGTANAALNMVRHYLLAK